MALISQSIPNLINGVSQQPPSLRLATQAELQENALSSVVTGLSKRPSSEHVADLGTISDLDKAFIHTIRRDENEFYSMVVDTAGTIRVFDKDGVSKTVTNNAASYLSGLTNPSLELAAVSIADTTFIVNKNKTIAKGTATSPTRNPEALVYVRQADYSSTYRLKVTKGATTETVEFATKSSTQDTTSDTQNAERGASTDLIAENLNTFSQNTFHTGDGSTAIFNTGDWYTNIQNTNDVEVYVNGTITSNYSFVVSFPASQQIEFNSGSIPSSGDTIEIRHVPYFVEVNGNYYENITNGGYLGGLTFTRYGSVIHIQSNDSTDFQVEVGDSHGNEHLLVFKDETPDFKKLPVEGPNDFVIEVSGDNQKAQDDYYVKFNDGVWKETTEPNTLISLDAATLPHKLSKLVSGDFQFDEVSYADRQVGNDDTNPFPSFIGYTIADIFFHRNRLGLLADENVIFARAGEFVDFDFFRKSVLALVDSDPIDVAVSSNKVSILKHAVPFNESLLLFSDLTQFKVTADPILTPETINVASTTEFEASLVAKPSSAGKYVYFSSKRGAFSGMWEYFVDTDTDVNDATEITAHVPQYLKGVITNIQTSSNEDMLIAQATDDPKAIYVYRYYWSGREKLQSSWSRWVFDGDVIGVSFNRADIFLLIRRSNNLFLEKINLSVDSATVHTTGNFSIHLDRRVMLETGGLTTIPYVDSKTTFYTGDGTTTTFDTGDWYTLIQNTSAVSVFVDGVLKNETTDYTFSTSPANEQITFSTAPINTSVIEFRYTPVIYVDQTGKTILLSEIAAKLANSEKVFAGIPFTFKYQFSEPVLKQDNKPITTGQLQLRNYAVVYNDTAFFNVTVTPLKRTPYVRTFTGRVVGSGANILNRAAIESGTYRFGVLGKSSSVSIVLESDNPLPCIFQSAEWEGFYVLRSRRL